MTKNMGTIDRALRLIVGVVLIAYALKIGFSPTGWNWVGWIGVIPILTALVGNCPLYSLFGMSTCPASKA
jgi:membrane-associated protease RseP (regulator of RpoE activity)